MAREDGLQEFLVIGMWTETGQRWADSFVAENAAQAESMAMAQEGDSLEIAGVVSAKIGDGEAVMSVDG